MSGLTPVERGAWHGFLRVHAAVVRALDAELESSHGLPLGSYDVLAALAEAPGRRLRMAELADHAALSRSGMTRLADRLEAQDLLRRETCTTDARGSYAALTAAGEAWVRDARSTHEAAVRGCFLDRFEDDELAGLVACWERILPGSASEVLTRTD
jgi:DNA-binding MarR family transcriptional regulator